MKRPLTVATCQFPISADIDRNLGHVSRQLKQAGARGADVVHFSEGCLSGYGGREVKTFKGFAWQRLRESTEEVQAMARQFGLWVILGSTHPLSGRHKPHNSLYIINSRGKIVDRYDKRFCCSTTDGKGFDLKHYSPGNHFAVFAIKGIKCGALICHDYRYPELYREYKRRGVQLMFHSFHLGYLTRKQWKACHAMYDVTVPATMSTYAACNHMWVSVNNTCGRESCVPSFFVQPDGIISGRLRRNQAGLMISTVGDQASFNDASVAWRKRCMRGVYHSGTLVSDPRSTVRTSL